MKLYEDSRICYVRREGLLETCWQENDEEGWQVEGQRRSSRIGRRVGTLCHVFITKVTNCDKM